VETTVDGVIWVKVGRLNVVGCYLCTDGSEVDVRDSHNQNAEEEIARILFMLRESRNEVIVLGDMNARMGELSSLVVDLEVGEEERTLKPAREYKRLSEDETETAQGRRIMALLNSGGIVVTNGLNGAVMGHTFESKGNGGCSAPDVIGVSESLLHNGITTRLIRDSDIDIGSDHVILYVELQCGSEVEESEQEAETERTTNSLTSVVGRQCGWRRPERDSGFWEEMRDRGEVEMREFIEARRSIDGGVLNADWDDYKCRTKRVLEDVLGRKKPVRKRKCQGRYYKRFDSEMQRLKRERAFTLNMLKHLRREGGDVDDLVNKYRTLRKLVKKRLKKVTHDEATRVTKKIEDLKLSNPKTAWRLLKKCLGNAPKDKTLGAGPVTDTNGVEQRGEAAREAVRAAFAQLGVHDSDDPNFDRDFEKKVAMLVERWKLRQKGERISQPGTDGGGAR
jgi:hypothetical protein